MFRTNRLRVSPCVYLFVLASAGLTGLAGTSRGPRAFLPTAAAADPPPPSAQANVPSVANGVNKALAKVFTGGKSGKESAEINALLRKRRDALLKCVEHRMNRFLAGTETVEFLLDDARRLAEAQLQLAEKPADRLAVRKIYAELTREMERLSDTRLREGRIAAQEYLTIVAAHLEAEIDLLRETSAQKQQGNKTSEDKTKTEEPRR